MSRKITSLAQLRDELLNMIIDVREKKVTPEEAKEVNTAASKVIDIVKLDLKYAEIIGVKTRIPFLEDGQKEVILVGDSCESEEGE